MKKNFIILILLCTVSSLQLQAQGTDTKEKECFIGSTAFILYNLVDDPEPPKYFQLNLGYRITPKDVISVEFIKWDYYEPLGVPLGQKSLAPNYPGRVRATGAGLAYKRFIWKRSYIQIHSTVFSQKYLDNSGKEIQKGIQLFNTLRLGYQFRFMKNRFFLEPSVALTFWPINTNLPDDFQVEENKWNSYYFPEPGLHFGYNF